MPHVLFVAPEFPANQRRFVQGLKNVGARVTGISDTRPEHLDPEIRDLLDGYEHVPHLGDEEAMLRAVHRVQARGPWVDRLEATVEGHMLTTARVRARASIPGLSLEQVTLCRDKFEMKQFLLARGIPCARQAAVSSADEAYAFVREVGFPVVLKPRDGAGAHATYKLDDAGQLARALHETKLDRHPQPFVLETFIQGHEGYFDTLTCRGEVVFEAITHYYPNVLEAMRTRWISPQMVTTNRIEAEGYAELRHFGRRVVRELELDTTATHMEWFYGPAGLQFAEIGARPPGCNFWDVYCAANDFDLYTEWARALLWGCVEHRPSRRCAAGLIALRPDRDGVIVGYEGVDELHERFGELVFRAHLPPAGTPTQPVEGGYLANAWVCVRHPSYDVVREVLDNIGRTVQVRARPM